VPELTNATTLGLLGETIDRLQLVVDHIADGQEQVARLALRVATLEETFAALSNRIEAVSRHSVDVGRRVDDVHRHALKTITAQINQE
jgi:ABC-type transporter Mla subunit MlaD